MDLGRAVKRGDDDRAAALNIGLERTWMEWEKDIFAFVSRSFWGDGDGGFVFFDEVDGLDDALDAFGRVFSVDRDETGGLDEWAGDRHFEVVRFGDIDHRRLFESLDHDHLVEVGAVVRDNEETLSLWKKLLAAHDDLDAEDAHKEIVVLTEEPKVEFAQILRSLLVFDEHRIEEKDGKNKKIKDIENRYGQRDGDKGVPRTEVGIEEIAKPSTDAERNYPMDNR